MPTFEETEKLVKERITGFRKGTDDIPNYTHSFHVRDILKRYGFNETVQMAGLLHDIVEDGNTSFDELRELGYSEEIIELVDLATHNMNIENPTDEEKFQRWENMMKRLEEANNKDAWAIKLADICDNVASCHTMKNDIKKFRFLFYKCPYFAVQGRKIFGESDFYLEFTNNYKNQLLRYIDFTKVGKWKDGEFRLTPEIHKDEKGSFIYIEGVAFRAVYGTKNFTGLGYAGFDGGNYNAFYIGEWVEGRRSGYGWIFYEDGDTYNGHLINGVKNGIGEMNMPEIGESYGGERKDDKMHGYGRRTYADGSEYVGDWNNGRIEGRGIKTYANGDVYIGDFVNGMRHGEGLFVYSNGTKIFSKDGWKNDTADGDFIGETSDGQKGPCKFKDGELVRE